MLVDIAQIELRENMKQLFNEECVDRWGGDMLADIAHLLCKKGLGGGGMLAEMSYL